MIPTTEKDHSANGGWDDIVRFPSAAQLPKEGLPLATNFWKQHLDVQVAKQPLSPSTNNPGSPSANIFQVELESHRNPLIRERTLPLDVGASGLSRSVRVFDKSMSPVNLQGPLSNRERGIVLRRLGVYYRCRTKS